MNDKEQIDSFPEVVNKLYVDNKERLSGLKAFISGAIDRVSDDGVGWRKKIKDLCILKGIKVDFLDPCDKPDHLGQEIGSEKKRMENLKSMGKEYWKKAQAEVKKFKRIDYRMVDMCDFYIIYVDINVHMCGSYFENKVAEEERKPIFVIMADGQKHKDLPTWLIDLVEYDEVFYGVEECVDYMEKLNRGEIEFNDRWIKVW